MDFSSFAAQPDGRLDALTGALLIARDEHPGLDIERERARLEALAMPLGSLSGRSSLEQIDRVSNYLYGSCGFRGNHEDYYDPRNSFIDSVMDRRVGIPISLALVYTEVARRSGVDAWGVAFPGHFLVRVEDRARGAPHFVDPFFGGNLLTREALQHLFDRAVGSHRPLDDRDLAPTWPRAVLLRILANLRGIYASRGEHSRLLLVLSRMLDLAPEAAIERRERGLVAARLGSIEVAKDDLRRYLATDPKDGEEVRTVLDGLTSAEGSAN